MSFGQAIRSGFSNYVRFSGRARRSEFWFWVLFNVIVSAVAGLLDTALGTSYTTEYGRSGGLVQSLAGLALLLPNLAIGWRRFHDIGKSGLWWLLVLIPIAQIVFVIIFIVWACKDSEPGANRFGPNPKQIVGPGHGGPFPPFGRSSAYGPPGQS